MLRQSGHDLLLAALTLVTSNVALFAQQAPELLRSGGLEPPFDIADVRAHDLDGDRKSELVLLGRGGEVRTLDAATGELRGTLVLKHPKRSLVAFARLGTGKSASLVVLDSDGLWGFGFAEGAFRTKSRRLLRRGKLRVRVGEPLFANFVQDINQDGHADFVLPGATDCAVYLGRPADKDANLQFVFASRLQLRTKVESSTNADRLSRELDHSVSIPSLRTRDVNGDGRGDLVAKVDERRMFHIQRPDGTFPQKPDVELDLSRFRDTTPKAEVELGRTLGQDSALLNTQDLDGDRIEDYVIAHRRKVWVYHGTKQGPQFDKPSKILILREDVTFLVLMHLDDDAFPDLLVFKLQVPNLLTLFLGLTASWDVSIRSIGYQNVGGKTFARTPKWRRETVIRVPSIVSLLSDPESIVGKFEDVGRSFRPARSTDLDGDGDLDVLLQTEDRKTLSFFLLEGSGANADRAADQRFRALLFEDRNNVWDVDRILGLLRSMADDRTSRLTRGRAATGGFPLRDPTKFSLVSVVPVDFDGDGRFEIALHYVSRTAPFRSAIDIIRLRS